MPLRLQLRYAEKPAENHVLFEGKEYLLGRAEDCDIVLDHPSVSRYHARLSARNGNWQLQDHNSQNGCYQEGHRVNSVALARCADVTLGPVQCRMEHVEHRQITAESSFRQWRNRYLSAATENLMKETSLASLLRSASDTLTTILSSDRAAVIFLDQEGSISSCSGFPGWLNDKTFCGSRTAIQQAVDTASPVVLAAVQQSPGIAQASSIIRGNIQALLVYPVVVNNKVVAVLYADSQAEHKAFLDTDLVIVRAFSRQLAMAFQIQDIEFRIQKLQVS